MALESESCGLFKNAPVLYTGLGKVNAAHRLTRLICDKKPSLIINLGSAGSSHFKTGTLVNCVQFIQRDMDVSPLGFEKWFTPFDNEPVILEYGERLDGFESGLCGTGDSFDVSGKKEVYTIVDMEAYALAKVCKAESIPFVCVKYVTDGADGNSTTDWEKNLRTGAERLFEAYRAILRG